LEERCPIVCHGGAQRMRVDEEEVREGGAKEPTNGNIGDNSVGG
jgi:hypothetical protein